MVTSKNNYQWAINEAQKFRPDLTEEQITEVLERVYQNQDATGADWETLLFWVDQLYPVKPPPLTDYTVEITETLQRQITVQADSPESAYELVKRGYDNNIYVLDTEHFMGADFQVLEADELPEEMRGEHE